MFSTAEGLPNEQEGIYYIVSKPVAEFTMGIRKDLLVTDEMIRINGRIAGCQSLAQMIS